MNNDFSALADMQYSGRAIILGMTPSGDRFAGYTLQSRSPGNQARKLVQGDETKTIRTAFVEDDATLMHMFHVEGEALATLKKHIAESSRALHMYPTMVVHKGKLAVSNGAHTKLLYRELSGVFDFSFSPQNFFHVTFDHSFFEYDEQHDRFIDLTMYEPDDPNFTSRISGVLGKNNLGFAILYKNAEESNRHFHAEPMQSEKAEIVTTYTGGNESPLISFRDQNPLEACVRSTSSQEICEELYEAIGPKHGNNYRVAAAVMLIRDGNLETTIINRAERGT